MDTSLILVLAYLARGIVAEDDCWIPCTNIQGGSCVSISCKTDLLSTFECHLISTLVSSSKLPTKQQMCIPPDEVPGMPQFCSSLSNNGSLLLENLYKEVTSKPTKTTQTVEDAPMDPESSCVPVAILAGVAVGCFTSGAIVMWLFLVVVWSKTNSKCGKEIPVESNLAGSYRTQEGTPSFGRHENSPARMMSISHQRLLSSTSIDSGMSSQIVSPPSFPAVAPVTDTIPNRQTDADIGSDYTRLNRESSQYSGENPQETDRNDYACLMTAEVPNISSPVQNPYMDLQTANQSATDQSETSAQSNQTDAQSAPDTCVTYPSISRSNKSDVHDYESIFSEGASNAGTDYMEFSSHRGSDGDCHEYHECGSERHEYFILETQTNDYFVLEKES